MSNPFDLSQKSQTQQAARPAESKVPKKYPSTKYTSEQIRELLKGYMRVDAESWSDIPTNSHIRYIKKDGSFVRGGFVTNHWLNKTGKKFIHVANGFNKNAQGYKTWPVAHENVSQIYKKPAPNTNIEMGVVDARFTKVVDQVNKLTAAVKSLNKKTNLLEAEIRKLNARN